ncbi:Acetyltransferase (GNAT) family protein OS=Ureibacillus acetophenoni OX=614649 GN=SAMN05877842_10510 PE=4 SV=1 [Ureibacillus acetophenoni]
MSSLTGLCVNFDPTHPNHSWAEATDDGYITNHDPNGNTLYIVDISVRPAYRSLGLGKIMMQSMYHIVIQLGLDRLLGGGRMPGYHKVAHEMTANEYVEAVLAGKIHDPVISFFFVQVVCLLL